MKENVCILDHIEKRSCAVLKINKALKHLAYLNIRKRKSYETWLPVTCNNKLPHHCKMTIQNKTDGP
jgi:hypothetical protein